MNNIRLSQVVQAGNQFLAHHWQPALAEPPKWSAPWGLVGTMPNNDAQGIYVLLAEELRVIYIGVGASLGGGRYSGHGLGARIKNYVALIPGQQGTSVADRVYAPNEKWRERGLTQIVTLGFPKERAYLAYGLEAFLLREFAPPYNKVRAARLA